MSTDFVDGPARIVRSDVPTESFEMTTVMTIPGSGAYFGLEGIARRIWDRLSAPVTVGELVQELVLRYDVSREDCERDVVEFLRELNDAGLLTTVR